MATAAGRGVRELVEVGVVAHARHGLRRRGRRRRRHVLVLVLGGGRRGRGRVVVGGAGGDVDVVHRRGRGRVVAVAEVGEGEGDVVVAAAAGGVVGVAAAGRVVDLHREAAAALQLRVLGAAAGDGWAGVGCGRGLRQLRDSGGGRGCCGGGGGLGGPRRDVGVLEDLLHVVGQAPAGGVQAAADALQLVQQHQVPLGQRRRWSGAPLPLPVPLRPHAARRPLGRQVVAAGEGLVVARHHVEDLVEGQRLVAHVAPHVLRVVVEELADLAVHQRLHQVGRRLLLLLPAAVHHQPHTHTHAATVHLLPKGWGLRVSG